MLSNRCTGIYKFGNNTYPRHVRHGSNLGHIFQEEKVCLMGQEIRYKFLLLVLKDCLCVWYWPCCFGSLSSLK